MNETPIPWWASKGMWGGIVTVVTGVGQIVGGFFSGDVTLITTGFSTIGGGILAIVGRVKAKAAIQ